MTRLRIGALELKELRMESVLSDPTIRSFLISGFTSKQVGPLLCADTA